MSGFWGGFLACIVVLIAVPALLAIASALLWFGFEHLHLVKPRPLTPKDRGNRATHAAIVFCSERVVRMLWVAGFGVYVIRQSVDVVSTGFRIAPQPPGRRSGRWGYRVRGRLQKHCSHPSFMPRRVMTVADIEPTNIIQTVDMWIDKQLHDAAEYDNCELLDSSSCWSLHQLARTCMDHGTGPTVTCRLRTERDELRAAIMRTIAACVEADVESIAFNGEPGVIKTTTIRSVLNGGSDEH